MKTDKTIATENKGTIEPKFKPGTCKIVSYAVFSARGNCEVSHETTAAMHPNVRLMCYFMESKGRRVV